MFFTYVAGICWTGMERGGRCSSVAALRVGRAECCSGGARAPAAWSPRDLDSGEIFFYKALSGGVPCTACAGKFLIISRILVFYKSHKIVIVFL